MSRNSVRMIEQEYNVRVQSDTLLRAIRYAAFKVEGRSVCD